MSICATLVFYRVDGERLQQFGPDRTCAEWILRNGGRIRFVEEEEWLSDYNLLPDEKDSHLFHVKDIDATGADLMFNGFLHLGKAFLGFDNTQI